MTNREKLANMTFGEFAKQHDYVVEYTNVGKARIFSNMLCGFFYHGDGCSVDCPVIDRCEHYNNTHHVDYHDSYPYHPDIMEDWLDEECNNEDNN